MSIKIHYETPYRLEIRAWGSGQSPSTGYITQHSCMLISEHESNAPKIHLSIIIMVAAGELREISLSLSIRGYMYRCANDANRLQIFES